MAHETQSPSGQTARPTAEGIVHATLHITVRDGGVMERELTLLDTRIGKGPDNEIILGDPAVSTNHALVRFDGQTHWLIDVGSRNGTFINNVRLTKPQGLKHDD